MTMTDSYGSLHMEREPIDKVSSLQKLLDGHAFLFCAGATVFRFRAERFDEAVNNAFQCSVRRRRQHALDETEN